MPVASAKPPTDELIHITNLCKTYYMGAKDDEALSNQVLFDLSLDIQRGEFASIMGHSGSGKSTLMNILGCLDTPTSGSYRLAGNDVALLSNDELAQIRNKNIGFVFQGFNLLKRMTALDNVAMPLLYAGESRTNSRKRAMELLDRIGLGDFGMHQPNQLSGGQQQRVAICRSLINQPPLILADEPTGNLDTENSSIIMKLFEQLNREQGITIVLVTHEDDVAAYTNRLIQLKDGRVIHDKSQNPVRNIG